MPRVSVRSTSAERADALRVFGVSHFAADVSYRINAFVEKNRDRLPNEICALAATSDAPFVATVPTAEGKEDTFVAINVTAVRFPDGDGSEQEHVSSEQEHVSSEQEHVNG